MRRSFYPVIVGILLLLGSAPVAWAQQAKVTDLGYYPGGTWSEPWGINIFGVIVGMGDIPSGYTRPIGVPAFGPNAGQWFDLGTLGGDRTDGRVMAMDISDTGTIVGHSAIAGNDIIHAFVWTPQSRMVDIGALADIGKSGYNYSVAYGTNRMGTLIVGWSGSGFLSADMLPVVWTPKVVITPRGPATTWRIHPLDTTGFEGATSWGARYANNFGQIIGSATAADGTQIAVVWNPLPGTDRWAITRLPTPAGYPDAEPSGINNKGEIVGDATAEDGSASFPVLWQPARPPWVGYRLTVLPTLAGFMQGTGYAESINNVGDIVGETFDADWNFYAAAWSVRDLKSARLLLGVPGGWSWASKVNNNGVATGSFASDTVTEDTVVWQLH